MPTARPIPLLRRTAGLALVPVLGLVAAACGGDDGAGSFCDRAGQLTERLAAASDPTTEEYAEAVADMRDIDPPEGIADDWDAIADTYEAFTELGDDEVDLAQLSAQVDEQANDDVDRYLAEECGV